MNFAGWIKRALLGSTASGSEGAKLVGTSTKANLNNASTVEVALAYINTFIGSAVSSTEFGYLDGVTSSIQTQLNAKGSGTVTSVGATSPLSSTGGTTPAISISNQSANLVLSGPGSGSAAAPTFRALVALDIPNLDTAKITSGVFSTARLGTGTANSSTYLRGDGTWQTIVASDPTLYTESDGGTITFNLANSKSQIVVLGGNRTLAVSGDAGNDVFDIMLKQDGTGSRTVTWFSGITWAGGSPPTLTTGANKTDWFGFRRTGSGTYTGVVVGANI